MVKQAKKSFFTNALKNKNTKQVWENIRYIVPGKSKKSKNANIGCIKTDAGEVSDAKEIVNTLNEYFASVGPNIAERIQAVQGDIPDDVSNDAVRNDDSFHFDNVKPDYVMDLLNSMHENKATGTDEIPAKLLKISADEIVLPLTYLVNLSLTTGTFPRQWKKSKNLSNF